MPNAAADTLTSVFYLGGVGSQSTSDRKVFIHLKRKMLTSTKDDVGYVSPKGPSHVDDLSPDVSPTRALAKSDKKRKLSHAQRKVKLEEEIRVLESGVAVLKTRGLSPQLILQKDPVLRPVAVQYSALLYSIHTHQLHVAKMQSALSCCLSDQEHYPLYSHIKLTKDSTERRAALLAMRDQKIHNALQFVMGLGNNSDHFKKLSENQFENDDGDLCCVRFESIQFPGVQSLQQVYDALSFYKNNMEIIISEQLGHITIRDDYDGVEEEAFHARIISTNEDGITTEGNVVSFREFFEDGYNGQPCAVLVADSVDEDQRYPYLSQNRVRKDLSTAVVLTENKSVTGDSDVVVTMHRASFYKIRQPEFPITFCEFENLRDATTQWSETMLKTMRGILYPARA